MKKKMWILVVLCAAALCMVFAGCARQNQNVVIDGTTYVRSGTSARGIAYTNGTDLWQWRQKGSQAIVKHGTVDLAVFTRNTARFTFPDGRILTGHVNGWGEVDSLSVETGITVSMIDYDVIAAAAAIHKDAYGLVSHKGKVTGTWMLILLFLGVATWFLASPLTAFLRRKKLVSQGDRLPLYVARGVAILLAVIPLLVMIFTGGRFR